MTPAQSGFCPGHSTQDLLIKVVEDWKSALDCDNLVGTVFIDLSKAFDSIDHGLLLAKLSGYGFDDIFYNGLQITCHATSSMWCYIAPSQTGLL